VVLEIAAGVFPKGFASHLYSGEVGSVTRSVLGRLVVGREEPGQFCLGGDTLC
jgi:hypothetical protein